MKNLTLGKKISFGFAAILAIAIALGGLAIFKMRSVGTGVHKLAEQYVPEGAICGDLGTATLRTRLATRSFGFTGDLKFHEQALKGMAEMSENIQKAKSLVAQYPSLVKLKAAVENFEKGFGEFTTLVVQTKVNSEALDKARMDMIASADKFVTQIEAYQSGQVQAMREDIKAAVAADKLEERTLKLELAAHVRNLMNQIRVAAWKAQAERDFTILQAVTPKFAKWTRPSPKFFP